MCWLPQMNPQLSQENALPADSSPSAREDLPWVVFLLTVSCGAPQNHCKPLPSTLLNSIQGSDPEDPSCPSSAPQTQQEAGGGRAGEGLLAQVDVVPASGGMGWGESRLIKR